MLRYNWFIAKPRSELIHIAFNQLRHCPRELSNATGLLVQIEPGELSKESTDTSTATDGNSAIKENTAIFS